MKHHLLAALYEGIVYVLGVIHLMLIMAIACAPVFIAAATNNSKWLWMLIISVPFACGVCSVLIDR